MTVLAAPLRDEMVSRYNAGETIQSLLGQAAEVANDSKAVRAMRENLKRWGAKLRSTGRSGPKRKHTLNESYFDVIDTEEEDDVTLVLQYGGGVQCQRILTHLYEGSSVSLDRKLLRFNSLCARPAVGVRYASAC